MEICIGKQIKRLRLEKGVTQEELAKCFGVSCQAVSKWENEVTMPDIQLLPEIAVYFAITIDELFKIPNEAHIERIEKMIENSGDITDEMFESSREFLEGCIKDEPENGRLYGVLSALYLAKANIIERKAAYYAELSLKYEPFNKYNHSLLVKSHNGAMGDWYCSCNFKLIDFYKEFTRKYPGFRCGQAFLFDQLIHDGRLEEAKELLRHIKTLGKHVENKFFQGDIELVSGNHEKAIELWDKAFEEEKDNWQASFLRAERALKLCEYNEAIKYYESALTLQKKPKFTEPIIAMSQIYELLGNYQEAISCREKEIEILKDDYNIVSREMIEKPLGEIERLRSIGEC